MSVLANVFEAAGLATVGISLVRRQAENARAPRMLHCQFPLGRPLGRPGDAAFQHDVIRRALALLVRTDVPVLEDHPEVIDDQSDDAASCPLPPHHDPDRPDAMAEADGLRRAYQRNLTATGRTLMGRVGGPDDLPDLLSRFLRLARGEPLDAVGWDTHMLLAASQDVRAFYEEAATQLADNTGARQVESWFYERTVTGRLLRAVRATLRAGGAERATWYYLVPNTQAE